MIPPSGRTFLAPQTFAFPPPPHISSDGHVPPSTPQVTTPPHPSPTTPQFIPVGHAVSRTHPEFPPQTLAVPPPPHVAGAVQLPQV
jgi:hypothetical protein